MLKPMAASSAQSLVTNFTEDKCHYLRKGIKALVDAVIVHDNDSDCQTCKSNFTSYVNCSEPGQ